MIVFLKRKKSEIDAVAEYDVETNKVTIKKGSILSKDVVHTGTFRSARSVEKKRQGIVENNVLRTDVTFNSPSTAANFVTGASTNGLLAWKNAEGMSLKELKNAEEK